MRPGGPRSPHDRYRIAFLPFAYNEVHDIVTRAAVASIVIFIFAVFSFPALTTAWIIVTCLLFDSH